MINKKEKVEKNGLMGLHMREIIKMERSQGLENSFGLMERNLKELGLIIRCMARVYLSGWMGDSIKVIIIKIKSKDLECSNGQMEEFMKGIGRMGSNMERKIHK